MDGLPRQNSGLTLIELLVVLSLFGLVLGIGVPGFQQLQETTRMRAEMHRLLGDILLTRSEAIKRNQRVVMCPSRYHRGGDKSCAGAFRQGWVIFSDHNGNREIDAGETVLRSGRGLTPGFTLTNRAGTRDAAEKIVYRPDGTSRRNRTLMICSRSHADIDSFSIVMNIVGRPRTQRKWGECPGQGA